MPTLHYRVRNFAALFFFAATLTSCKKEDVGPALTSLQSCVKSDATAPSPLYNRLVFSDEFNGPQAGEKPECYSMAPRCSANLREFKEGPCPPTVNAQAIRLLNKCTWNLWYGFSFWETTGHTSFMPDLIEVSGGTLKLKLRVKNPNPLQCNDNQLNCKLEGAGVDTKSFAGSVNKGRSFKTGRIEIRAKFPAARNAFNALWTWPLGANEGYPHQAPANWAGYRINELDLIEARSRTAGRLEGWQTVHDWGNVSDKHVSKSSLMYDLNADSWHVYKLERTENRVRLWIDDCLTVDQSSGKDGFTLTDWPNFIMLWQTGEFWYGDVEHLNGLFSEIDWIRIYEN